MGDTSGNHIDVKIYYGRMTTWSDSFLRLYVKQKMNNVWMHTITLSDLDGNSSSLFHTYCVAAGQGNLNHTLLIEWYPNRDSQLHR